MYHFKLITPGPTMLFYSLTAAMTTYSRYSSALIAGEEICLYQGNFSCSPHDYQPVSHGKVFVVAQEIAE